MLLYIIYYSLVWCVLISFVWFVLILYLFYLVFDWKISSFSLVYIGFADGASYSTWNLASTTWFIFSP